MAKAKKPTLSDRQQAKTLDLASQVDRVMLDKAKAEQKCKELLEQQKKENRLKERAKAKIEGVIDKLTERNSTARQVSIDAASGSAAQLVNESWNYLMRLLAESAEKKDPESWMVQDVDVLQSVPNTLIGMATYLTEMITRPKFVKDKEGKDTDVPYLPSWGREFWSHAGNILFNLGFSNIARMARYRLAENVDERVEAKRAIKVSQAESDALKAERDTLLSRIRELEAKK